jgi:quercetin dioxygenase-like cupin family protein
MKNVLFAIAAACIALASIRLVLAVGVDKAQKEIVRITPQDVRWFTPPYYADGRQRAQLLGDSNQGGTWIDRIKIPAGDRVPAHTHPHDEIVTVIEGTWYLGEGKKFDPLTLKPYPAGSFIVIPAGVPHFVAANNGVVIVQLSGTGRFGTEYLEK